MYKKIKNGSFMNWIWFIVAIFPILLIFIYTLGFFDNEEKTILINEQQKTIINNEFIFDNPNENNWLISNNYIFRSQSLNTGEAIEQSCDLNGEYIIYVVIYSIPDNLTSNLVFLDENGNFYEEIDYTTNNFFKLNINITNSNNNKFYIAAGGQVTTSNSYLSFGYFITTYNNLTREDFINNNNYYEYTYYTNIQIEKAIYSNFEDYLAMIKNTLQSNGFISSAFLNLAQLLGVTNVYYSLACYYIEYLLVIILLHLAFDVLYMLPNICHKFMEKLGGERD